MRRLTCLGLSSALVLTVVGAGTTTSVVVGATAVAADSSSCSSTSVFGAEPNGFVQRIDGPDRDATAVAISQDEFPGAGQATAVVLASDADFPDALTGAPLAVDLKAPLLVTSPSGLSSAVDTEIHRVTAAHATVYILGGPDAVSPSVDSQLTTEDYSVQRVAGADRFATAVAIADMLGDPATVLEANGLDFPDALAAGPAALQNNAAILLTDGDTQAAATTAYFAAHSAKTYAIGGPAHDADPGAEPIVGADRYATAVLVAQRLIGTASFVGFATGADFSDALAGGVDVGYRHGPMILVPPCLPLPPEVDSYASSLSGQVQAAELYGGPLAVSYDVEAKLDSDLSSAGSGTGPILGL